MRYAFLFYFFSAADLRRCRYGIDTASLCVGRRHCTLRVPSAKAERPAVVSAQANAFVTQRLPWTRMTAWICIERAHLVWMAIGRDILVLMRWRVVEWRTHEHHKPHTPAPAICGHLGYYLRPKKLTVFEM